MKTNDHHRILFIVTIIGVSIDLALYYLLLSKGVAWNTGHVISFLAGAVIIHLLQRLWPRSDTSPEAPAITIPEDMMFQLLALFFRGGVLAALVKALGWSPKVAIILAVAGSCLVTILSTRIRLLARQGQRDKKEDWWQYLTIAIIVFLVLMRFVYSWTFELLHEEAYYWNYAQHLDIGYLDHPPMVSWLIWVFTSFLGNTEGAVRMGALVSWLVTAYFIYKLALCVWGKDAALRAVLLLVVFPIYFGIGLVMTPDSPLMACWAGCVYYLYRSLAEGRRGSWLGVGIFMGLGMLSKYTIVLLGPATLVFMLMDRDARRWFARPEPYLAVGIALVLFIPVIIWNMQNDWASFFFQGPRRVEGSIDFDLPDIFAAICTLLTPPGFLAAVATVASKKSILPEPVDKRPERTYRLLLTSTIVPLSVFVFFSLFKNTKLNWTGPVWLGILPYIAVFTIPTRTGPAGRLPKYASSPWPATIVTMMFLYGIAFHYLVLGFPGAPYYTKSLGIGIPSLAEQVEVIENDFERRNGEKPFILCVDSDRLAGWIAFYRAKMAGSRSKSKITEIVHNTSGGHIFGKDSHMYQFWHPIELFKDRTILLIGLEPSDLMEKQVTDVVEPISKIRKIVVRNNGKITERFFYQFVKIR